jgi:hypothetical protein
VRVIRHVGDLVLHSRLIEGREKDNVTGVIVKSFGDTHLHAVDHHIMWCDGTMSYVWESELEGERT